MRSTTFRVVLDANALFPNTLRDALLRAAAAGLYQVQWSAQILEEARRNLVLKGIMSEDRSKRLVEQMQRAFPEALITGYEGLISSMKNNEGDRHVTAVAVLSGAEVIVTSNLKHFRREDLPPGSSQSRRTRFSWICSTLLLRKCCNCSGPRPRT